MSFYTNEQENILFNVTVNSLKIRDIKINNFLVTRFSRDEIFCENENHSITFKRSEIGDMTKPQLSNFKRYHLVNDKWI